MKKLFFMVLSAFLFACTANAQISEEIQKSVKRAQALQALCNDYKPSGNGNVDSYGDAVKAAAAYAILNSVQLDSLYKRQIGVTEDGVTDVTIAKPTLEQWIALGTTVAGEALSIKTATDMAEQAGKEAAAMTQEAGKTKNPMKAAKVAKAAKLATAVVQFGNEATVILLEESAAQAKAIKTIIETLKSGKNL